MTTTETRVPKSFCECAHSYWSHHVGFYNALGRPDRINGTLRHICERQGCRCLEYSPEVAPRG